MTIRVETNVGPKELERALWVTLVRHTPGLRVLPVTLLLCLGVVVAAAAAALSGTPLPGLVYLFAAACGLFALGVPLGLRRVASRSGARLFEYTFDDEGFDVRADGKSARVAWNTLYETIQTRRMVVLCEKPSVFHVLALPKGEAPRDAIDALIAKRVKRKRETLNVLSWMSPGFIMLLLIAAFLVVWHFS